MRVRRNHLAVGVMVAARQYSMRAVARTVPVHRAAAGRQGWLAVVAKTAMLSRTDQKRMVSCHDYTALVAVLLTNHARECRQKYVVVRGWRAVRSCSREDVVVDAVVAEAAVEVDSSVAMRLESMIPCQCQWTRTDAATPVDELAPQL
jgi:hypothetical protein